MKQVWMLKVTIIYPIAVDRPEILWSISGSITA
jgi:hypothetical protein